MKTKTFIILVNYRALIVVSKNAEKNLKNNRENKSDCLLIREIFPKICFVFIKTFVWEMVQSLAMIQIEGN